MRNVTRNSFASLVNAGSVIQNWNCRAPVPMVPPPEPLPTPPGLVTVDPQPASAISDDTHIAIVVILSWRFILGSPRKESSEGVNCKRYANFSSDRHKPQRPMESTERERHDSSVKLAGFDVSWNRRSHRWGVT